MTFLPIVARELRVAARRRSTIYFRLVAVGLGLLVLLFIMAIPDFGTPQRLGKTLFTGLSFIAFWYVLLIGMFTTADCVSEEKREGTLGLLFLTDLKGYDIVLGKLVATSVNAVYGLLALFPIMAIPLLAGGVTGAELWRVVLALLNSIFLSLAAGMFVSAFMRDERIAMSTTFLLLLFLTGGLPLTGALLNDWGRQNEVHPAFLVLSPAYTYFTAFEKLGAGSSPNLSFYVSLLSIHALAWVGLLLACFVLPRSWQEKGAREKSSRSWRQEWRFGSSEERLQLRRRLLASNPFDWLASRNRVKTILVWVLFAILGLFWLWGLLAYGRTWLDIPVFVGTALILQTVLKMWVANEACRQLGQDRKSGALELILSTPLSVRQIVDGQLMALWRQFSGPVAAVLLVELFFLVSKQQENAWVLACVASMSIMVADMVALSWLGMWLGLNARSLHRAAAAAMVRVLVLPWLLYGLLMFVLLVGASSPLFRALFQRLENLEAKFFIGAWFLIAAIADLVFSLWARRKLLSEFRQAATRNYGRGESMPPGQGTRPTGTPGQGTQPAGPKPAIPPQLAAT